MEKRDFAGLENVCQFRFREAGSCFHVCSQENHPVLFHNEDEFKAAMNVVAFVAILYHDLRIFTFEIMDNHFHFALSGKKPEIELFLSSLISKLASHPSLSSSKKELKNLSFTPYPIEDLYNLRNVIAYINRNGAVVRADESVYTYKWGANRFFFNREAILRHESCGHIPTSRERRSLFHSDFLAKDKNIYLLDGYVSPVCFCHINAGELFFRNNRHYFYCISRNVEASAAIARTIGENIYYSDEDLFVHIITVCSKDYGCRTVAELPGEAKIAIAKDLHYNYNAKNKQISRLLKISLSVISSMFPEKT